MPSDQQFFYYDRWAFHEISETNPETSVGFVNGNAWNGFMFVFADAWDAFVALPFVMWTFGAEVKLCEVLQRIFVKYANKCQNVIEFDYWWSFWIFLPIFLLFECILGWRNNIMGMVREITVRGAIVGGTVFPTYQPEWLDIRGLR